MKKLILFLGLLLTSWQISAQYCTPAVLGNGCTAGDDTDNFVIPLAGFSHLNSGCSPNNYGDFTADPALEIDFQQGVVYDFQTTHNFASQWIKIWIDFDQSDSFEASEEVFASTAGSDVHNGSLTIPLAANLGTTRLRLVNIYFQTPSDPCSPAGTFGETHDYTVNILPAPTCPAPLNLALGTVTTTTSDFTWDDVPNATNGYIWEVFDQGADPDVDPVAFSGTFPAGSTSGQATGLTPTSDYDFYLTADCGATDGISTRVGPVAFSTLATCLPPTNVALTSTLGQSADFSWDDEPGAVNGYLWEVYLQGNDPSSDPVVSSGTFPAGSTTGQATGLSASTDYDFYITSDCGATNGLSNAFGPVPFSTACDVFPAPFVESFDGTTIPLCWSQSATQSTTGAWLFSGSNNSAGATCNGATDHTGNGGNYAWMDQSGTDVGVILELPPVDVSTLNVPYLEFFHFLCTGDYSPPNETYVEAFDGSGWVQVAFINTGIGDWEEYGFDLSSFVFNTNLVQLRFRVESGGSANDFWGDNAIDDVSIIEAPTCIKPSNLAINNLSFDAVDFSWDNITNAINGYIWEVYNAGDDPAATTPVSTGTFAAGTTQGFADGLSPETNYDLYLISDCGATDGLSEAAGPLSFTTTELCSLPLTFDFANVLPDSVELNWTAVLNASNGYNWFVFLAGADPATATPEASGTAASSDTSVTVTGLSANTDYEAYIVSDCGADGLSDQSNALAFSTPCDIFVAPYFNDFENMTATTTFSADDCWTEQSPGGFAWDVSDGDTPSLGTGPNVAFSGSNFLFTEATTGAQGDEALLISPIIDLSALSVPALSFYYHMHGAGMGDLVIDVDAGSGYDLAVSTISGEQQVNQADPWIQQLVDLSAYAGQTVTIRFRGVRGPDFESDMSIDDVSVDEAPSCFAPANLTSSNLTDSSIDFSWDEVANASSGYNWELYLTGDDPATSTPEQSGNVPFGTTSLSITGLVTNTSYDFYILSDCGAVDGVSPTLGPVTFFTPPSNDNACDAIPLTVGVIPPGDTYSNIGATTEPNDPQFSCTTNPIDGTVWFTFDAPASGEVEVSTNIPGGSLVDTILSVHEAPTDCTDLSTLGVELGCNDDLNGLLSTVTLTGLTPGTTYYIMVDSFGTVEGTFGVSVIDTNPPCPNAENVQFISSTTTTADFTWDDVVEETDGYNWYIFDFGANTGADAPLFTGSVGPDVPSVTVTGLSASTTYDFYVEANCGATDGLSILSDAVTFSTQCSVFVAPYVENFDGAGWVSGTGFGNTNDEINSCWDRNPESPDYFWGTRTGTTGSGATGPSAANSGPNYIFTESSNGINGDEALFFSPLIDVSNLNSPALFFWYHMFGATTGTLSVDVDAGSGFDLDVFTIY